MTGLMSLLGSLASLALLLFQQYFSGKAAADAQNVQFKMSQEIFEQMVNQALTKMRFQAREDSGQAQSVEDQVDQSVSDRTKGP